MPKPLTPGEVARHSRDGEGESEHFHEALSVSLSLDSSPKGRAFLLVKLEFIGVNIHIVGEGRSKPLPYGLGVTSHR